MCLLGLVMLMLTQFAAFAPFLFPAQFADVTITVSLVGAHAEQNILSLQRPNKQFCDAISPSLLNFHSGNKTLPELMRVHWKIDLCRMNLKWRATLLEKNRALKFFALLDQS